MAWSEILVLSFLLTCGFIQCQKEGPPSGAHRHVCRESNDDYDCIFKNVFIDDLDSVVLFGNANEKANNELWLTFVNSTLRILPRSLVDTYTNVELLKLERLQIETIERNALANGRKIEELYLNYNKLASLNAGVFDHLHSLEVLGMDGNQLSELPAQLFQYTSNLKVVSLERNKLQRIADDTFHTNTNLESVYMEKNRLIHFDLSLITNLNMADVNNNLLQGLNIPARMIFLDASNNQLHSVVAPIGNMVEFLNVSHNKLNTTAWLTPFTKLRSLDLSYNDIEDITPTDFNKLTRLNILKLNNNRLLTFEIPSSLNRSLKILDLSYNNLVNLDYNLELEQLYLDHNSLVNANLGVLKKLRNLTLSHNDWDCVNLENVSSRLTATTMVDYDTETDCRPNYTRETGICCTASDIHDRLIKYMAQLSAYERADRANGRCSGDTVYDMAKNVSNTIASPGPSPSPTLAKEVYALKSEVERLDHSTSQATYLASKGTHKIDELVLTYDIPKIRLNGKQLENLQKVLDHLKQRDACRVNAAAARERSKNKKEKEIDDMEHQVNQIDMELHGKRMNISELQKQITKKSQDVKRLQAIKNKNHPSAQRHVCTTNNDNYDCIFRDVVIDNLTNEVLFGHAVPQWNYQSRLTFVNSMLRILPRSLVDSFTNVELLNLERLQIETIEQEALDKGWYIKELYLSYNNISSFDAGVFNNLHSLELLMMVGNHLSSLPNDLFFYTTNLKRIAMASNDLSRIEDGTFNKNIHLETVNVASNRLIHFDLSFIPSFKRKIIDVKNNQLQELNITGSVLRFLDASNNQIRSVVAQTGNLVEHLFLSNNKLNTTAWLKPFTKLTWLDLSFNEIEDITSTDFEQLPELNTLKLNNNRLFTIDIPSSLNRSLKILDLSHNNLVYVDCNLELEELYLDHNSIVIVNVGAEKLRNLTLSHNDWDCVSLANLSSRLAATTVVDYETETHCKENYTRETGICCTASDIHDRLIKYMAQLSVHERAGRINGRCSEDTVYDMAKNVSNAIASSELPSSPTLAKEVQGLTSDVQRLEDSINQARSQMEKDESKIDELVSIYLTQTQWFWKPWEKLQRVFDRLKERDAFMVKETVARGNQKRDKDKELEDMERQVEQIEMELDGKTNNLNELQKQIMETVAKVKKLE